MLINNDNYFEILENVKAQIQNAQCKAVLIYYKALENGWSRNVLMHQVGIKLFERQAIADKATNFEQTLPSAQSELAQETLKNPYVFDFVEAREGIIEREIEQELVTNIAKTIMELGTGFAFVGNQYHIEIGNKDYYIDLLFYNLKLSCFVVIEIKNAEFKPEHACKIIQNICYNNAVEYFGM